MCRAVVSGFRFRTVFVRIDYGCIKQTLVRFGYIKMTVSEQAD